MSQCPATAAVEAQGVELATLRCDGGAHHDGDHRITLTWSDAEGDAVALLDPDEDFDVEVDALPHDEVIEARIESRAVGDDVVVERSHEAIHAAEVECAEACCRLDAILAEHRESIRRQGDEAAAARADRARGE